jgi:thioredoxin-like negative regulator of GroEL
VVDFYKGGCPTCLLLDGTMNKLADEYKGRAVVARFELMKPYFAVTAPGLKAKYDISLFPTVVLFVNGEERHRWVMEYKIDKYRSVLRDVLGGVAAAAQPPGSTAPGASPTAQ